MSDHAVVSDEHTDEAPKKPKGARYWTQRILVGIVGAVVTLSIMYAGTPKMLAVALGAVAAYGAHEFYRAVQRQGAEPAEVIGILACLLFQASAIYSHRPLFNQFFPVLLALVLIAALLIQLGKKQSRPIRNIGSTVTGVLYVGYLLSFYTKLRVMTHHDVLMAHQITNAHVGSWLVMFVCAVTWLGDTMGLIIGYLFGRHKLAPTISPAKTREGAAGSIVGASLFGWLIGSWLGFPAVHAIVLGGLMGLFGLVGDLWESAMKRDLGLKDFGTVFGNHGGVLDRIDSLLFTAPVVYYYILLFLSPR